MPTHTGLMIAGTQVRDVDVCRTDPSLVVTSAKYAITLWRLQRLADVANGDAPVDARPQPGATAGGSADSSRQLQYALTEVESNPRAHDDACKSVRFAPDGSCVVSAGDDKAIQKWRCPCLGGAPSGSPADVSGDVSGGALAQPLARVARAHGAKILRIAFAPDAASFATCAKDCQVHVWATVTLVRLRAIGGPRNYVRSLAYSPSGAVLGGGTSGGVIMLWEVRDLDRSFLLIALGPLLCSVPLVDCALAGRDGRAARRAPGSAQGGDLRPVIHAGRRLAGHRRRGRPARPTVDHGATRGRFRAGRCGGACRRGRPAADDRAAQYILRAAGSDGR